MNRYFVPIVLGTAALAACNVEPEQVVAGETPDPMAGQLAGAPPVELPPAIAASKTYRCKDNSLVTIDWLQGGKGANLRVGDATAATPLRPPPPPEEGATATATASAELTAEGGYALTGDAAATDVNLTLPGKGKLSCHV